MTCDLCQNLEAEELRFCIMGKDYALDLCSSCRAIYDNLMADYVAHSRRITFKHGGIRRDGPAPSSTRPRVNAVDNPVKKPVRKSGKPRKKVGPNPSEVSS